MSHALPVPPESLCALLEETADAALVVGPDRRIVLANAAAYTLLADLDAPAGSSGLVGRELTDLVPGRLVRRLTTLLRRLDTATTPLRIENSGPAIVGRHGDGTEFQASVVLTAAVPGTHGGERYYGVIVRDLSAQRRSEERLRQLTFLATHDALTRLPNREMVTDFLSRSLLPAPGRAGSGAVLFVNVNGFTQINERWGHLVGDGLLSELARRLDAARRPGDLLGRYGGDEFVLVCPEVRDGLAVEQLARRLRALADEPLELAADPVTAPISVGAALFRRGSRSAADVLLAADAAVHEARAHDGVHVVDLDEESDWNHLGMLKALARATQDDSLEVHFQPIVALASGQVSAFEALVRWNHDGRLACPATFIPLAEDTGLIVDIDLWTLRHACLAMPRLAEAAGRPVSVAVNFSAVHFRGTRRPAEQIGRVIAETGADPARLVIEVTETAEIMDRTATARALADIRALGCGVSLDDFGTGYASLNYLLDLPATIVKVDQSFTSRIGMEDPTAAAVTAGLVQTCRLLGINVVAEGIETPAERDRLIELGAAFGQGYLWDRPLPLPVALDRLRERATINRA